MNGTPKCLLSGAGCLGIQTPILTFGIWKTRGLKANLLTQFGVSIGLFGGPKKQKFGDFFSPKIPWTFNLLLGSNPHPWSMAHGTHGTNRMTFTYIFLSQPFRTMKEKFKLFFFLSNMHGIPKSLSRLAIGWVSEKIKINHSMWLKYTSSHAMRHDPGLLEGLRPGSTRVIYMGKKTHILRPPGKQPLLLISINLKPLKPAASCRTKNGG